MLVSFHPQVAHHLRPAHRPIHVELEQRHLARNLNRMQLQQIVTSRDTCRIGNGRQKCEEVDDIGESVESSKCDCKLGFLGTTQPNVVTTITRHLSAELVSLNSYCASLHANQAVW